MNLTIKFCGAAQSVTGSCYLVQAGDTRVLVDCGIFQERDLRQRNWEPFPFDPARIDVLLLTHAHNDHVGRVPKLVREGFRGRILCTEPTEDIARIVLLDAAKIQEEDLAFKGKRHAKENRANLHPLAPLYTQDDVERAMRLFGTVAVEQPVEIAPGLTATFHLAGHILGATMITLNVRQGTESRTILFSGDVGRWHIPILPDPTLFAQADYVVCESTYGNRVHEPSAEIPDKMAQIVNETHAAGGNLVIPSFAVERTQDVLYCLNDLLIAHRIPKLAIFVDSPMAVRVTEVFLRHPDWFDQAARDRLCDGRGCDFPGMSVSRTADESKAIKQATGPSIIMAGSGMCDGGRIKHHLVNNISRPESTILFVGYQAVGTLGRTIVEKPREVRILGQLFPVRARIARVDSFSGHADRDELFRWLSALQTPPRRLFLTHGDAAVAAEFAVWIRQRLNWKVIVPAYQDQAELD